MRTTLKSINDNLPRFDVIRRHYMPYGATGWVDGRRYLRCVFADIDPETGNCIDITFYASEEALAYKHYYADRYPDTVFEITEQIEEVFSGALRDDFRTSKEFRLHIVRTIQEVIENGNQEEVNDEL